jgi:hypothetical protein
LAEPHREIDRGVIRYVEQQDLRCAHEQRGLHPRRLGRQAAREQMPEQMPKRAEPAQCRCRQCPHQGAVAIGQCREIGCAAWSSSCSSSGRLRLSTPSRMSAAIRRAARPGGSTCVVPMTTD